MKKKDAELIQRTLDGDQSAFTALVKKYQKGVHALAWQKIGDFHVAQEITQDAFLRAYQKLGTLKNHNLFSGWLYVIASRLCCEWLRKKRLPMQSLETVDNTEVDQVAYTRYVEEQREADAEETRRELVRNLLKKLPESERTVMTLHYLGEMTCESISEFLGVSQNTIKSRLSRARNRLKKEEAMIKENLSSFQLPTQFTENIMKEISRLNPIAPSGSKPLVPLAMSAAAAIFVVLLMGVGAQNLIHFQEPYQLDATSESMIEIVDTQYVLDTSAKPALRNQVGRSDVTGKSNGIAQNPDSSLFAAALDEDAENSKLQSQWVQTKGPEGGEVPTLFKTTRGDVYAGAQNGLYRLTDDGTAWKLISNIKGPSHIALIEGLKWWPVVERHDTLYLATNKEILASTDRGETWEALGESIEGQLVDMVITDGIPGTQSEMTIYLARTNGVFRTDNAGKSWTPLSEGLTDRKIREIAAIENTLFAGTDKGLYRLNSDTWEQLPINPENTQDKTLDISALAVENTQDKTLDISALAVTENYLYVATKAVWIELAQPQWVLYRSTDQGNSWDSITPRHDPVDKKFVQNRHFSTEIYSPVNKVDALPRGIIISEVILVNTMRKITASGEKVMVIDDENHFYSIDAGETWISLTDAGEISRTTAAVLLNATTFYSSGTHGIHRTTDSGESWHQFNAGLVNTNIKHLNAINGILYANTETGLVNSTDEGESWTPVLGDTGNLTHIVESNEKLYASKGRKGTSRFFRLSSEGNSLTDIPGIPVLKNALILKKNQFWYDWMNQFWYDWIEIKQNENQFFIVSHLGSFAVTDSAYYVEYQHKLFRWNIGTLNWYDTGVTDMFAVPNHKDFRFAVSGKTIYVGKRDGHLLQSFDEGNTWNDITAVTANLPFSIERFNAITFAGQTVYVATDKGVIRSNNGIDWYTLTDAEGTPLVVDRFAVDGTTVYSQVKRKIYQIKEDLNTWQQVTPEIPYHVNCFDVDGNTLYVGTFGWGVLRFTLDE